MVVGYGEWKIWDGGEEDILNVRYRGKISIWANVGGGVKNVGS